MKEFMGHICLSLILQANLSNEGIVPGQLSSIFLQNHPKMKPPETIF